MTESSTTGEGSAFARARSAWLEGGRPEPLERWLTRQLDGDGVPRTCPVGEWWPILAGLAEARRARSGGWPEVLDALVERLLVATIRFARPDGRPVFGPTAVEDAPGPAPVFRDWARWLDEPGIATVLRWWFPARGGRPEYSSPPLPADARPDRPLAMLRASWTKQGELLGIDHRAPGASSLVELYALGRSWLGPSWALDAEGAAGVSRARPTCWLSTSSADLAEWTFRSGGARVVRTALMLRGRRVALLADQVDGPAPAATQRIGLAEGVTPAPVAESRAVALTSNRGRSTVRAFPIGLPRLPYPTDRGSFRAEAGSLLLSQRSEGKRLWLPLLISWEPARNRMATHWRLLTVSEKSRVCPPEVAFAARITWGRDETLVIYRSLGRPAPRNFLGHQTSARFLVGLFSRDSGKVEPLLTARD